MSSDDTRPGGEDPTGPSAPASGGFTWAAPGAAPTNPSGDGSIPMAPPAAQPASPSAGRPGNPQPGYPPAPGYPALPAYPQPALWAAPTRPGIVWLRPLDLGEILGGAFRLLRLNPKATIGFSFLVQLLGLALALPFLAYLVHAAGSVAELDDSSVEADVDPAFGYLGNLMQIPSWLLTAAAAFILCVVVSRAVLGEKITVRQAWAHAKPSLWRYLGLQVGLLLALVAAVALCVGIGLVVLPLGVILGMVLALAVVFLGIRWGFAATALVLERLSIGAALRRSWALTDGQFWRIFGIRVLTGMLVSLMSSVLVMPVMLVAMVLGFATATSDSDFTTFLVATVTASAVAGAIAGAIETPVSSAVDTLLYLDQRMRREGLDLRLAAVVAERTPQER